MAYKYVNDNGLKAYTKKVKGALKDLHAPIAIFAANTPDGKAQNVKNIADFIAKAKAAGIADVNGMAVTCLIDSGYSGVGYLYFVDGNYTLQGVLIKDDLENNMCFSVWEDGSYKQLALVTGEVTSLMLDKGARKPIILTTETTEVDEETYQKLLSDDVDVVFKTEDGELCTFTYKNDNGDSLQFYFTGISGESVSPEDIYIFAYSVIIVKNDVHKCTLETNVLGDSIDEILTMAGYLTASTLSPVLQEIDLTGTDAERKAKLAQFEKDWKNLTGASDMTGARFVGLYIGKDTNSRKALFIPVFGQDEITAFEGISTNSDRGYSEGSVNMNEKVFVDTIDGSIEVTPLFSHLEAIIINTANTLASKNNNIKHIHNYTTNLENLGVNIDSIQIPVSVDDGSYKGSLYYSNYDGRNVGILMKSDSTVTIIFQITETGEYIEQAICATADDVQDVNILAQAVKAFGAIELKASDNAANKAALTAYLKILTDAGVTTTNGYSVPVRITGNAQEYHGMLNIGTGALLSGIVTDVNENHHYPFNVSTADGAITFDANNYFLEKTSNEVTEMLDAIKYSYTPVPLTATTLSNKAQLEVFLSKVPNAQVMHCTYKDVYAGTLHKINGDWFGLLVKNTNNYEDALQVKLQADGTLIEGTTSLAQVNSKLDTIIG